MGRAVDIGMEDWIGRRTDVGKGRMQGWTKGWTDGWTDEWGGGGVDAGRDE